MQMRNLISKGILAVCSNKTRNNKAILVELCWLHLTDKPALICEGLDGISLLRVPEDI